MLRKNFTCTTTMQLSLISFFMFIKYDKAVKYRRHPSVIGAYKSYASYLNENSCILHFDPFMHFEMTDEMI